MNDLSKNDLPVAATLMTALPLLLITYSLSVGWDLATVLLFWFIIVPSFAVFIPNIIVKKRAGLIGRLSGLMFFYAVVVFLIYSQYATDFFRIMMVSAVVNSILVALYCKWERFSKADSQARS